jgi:hypothetical protein
VKKIRFPCFVFTIIFSLAACTTVEVRTTDFKPAERIDLDTPDQFLLDVGLQIFTPNLEDIPSDEVIFTNVRESEAVWVSQQLKETLEYSNAWGVVRVIPDDEVVLDINVKGRVIQSDGETLTVAIEAIDSTGKTWLEKEYTHVTSLYSYHPSLKEQEPFQGLYSEISDDLLKVLLNTDLKHREDVRTMTTIRFAKSFSPDAFSEYIEESPDGQYSVKRLPALNDPQYQRIENIKLRDQLFVDVLQDYYVGFTNSMEPPYREWRAQSFRETQLIKEFEGAAKSRRIAGWVSILSGVAGLYDNSNASRIAGGVGIYAGAELIRSSFQKRDEAALHIQTLNEVSKAIENELEPSVIQLQDRTITLTGTVRDQYDEWREILKQMYLIETGGSLAASDSKASQ